MKDDGLTALFETRRDVELAIERLVQEHGLDRAEIFVEPVGDAATAGVAPGGGDHASGAPGSAGRSDAPLEGAMRLTAPVTAETEALVRDVLTGANGRDVRRTSKN